MATWLKLGGILWCFLSLNACVTTTTGVAVSKDKKAAHSTRIDLGMKYLSVDRRDKARWQFNKALELEKNSPLAIHGLALVHQANGEAEPAEKLFLKAIKLAQDKTMKSGFEVSYGRFLYENDRTKEACPLFESAAADYDYGRRSDALYMAAKCAEKIGNFARVKPAYEHSMNLNARYTPSMIELAEIYFAEGDYANSKKLLDRFMKLTNPTARSLWLGVRIERIFGNADQEASYALALKNLHPYSNEYLEYKRLLEKQ